MGSILISSFYALVCGGPASRQKGSSVGQNNLVVTIAKFAFIYEYFIDTLLRFAEYFNIINNNNI